MSTNGVKAVDHKYFGNVPDLEGQPNLDEQGVVDFQENYQEFAIEEDQVQGSSGKRRNKKSGGMNPMVKRVLLACAAMVVAGSLGIGGWAFYKSRQADDADFAAPSAGVYMPAETQPQKQPINPLTGSPIISLDQPASADESVFVQDSTPEAIVTENPTDSVQPQGVSAAEPAGREVTSFPAVAPDPQAQDQIRAMVSRVDQLEAMLLKSEERSTKQMAAIEAALQGRTNALVPQQETVSPSVAQISTVGQVNHGDSREMESLQKKFKEQTGVIAQLRREKDDLQNKLKESLARFSSAEKINAELRSLVTELEKKVTWLLTRPVMPGWRVAGMSAQFVMFRSDDGSRMVKMAPGDVFAGIKILKIDMERSVVETNYGSIKAGGGK